MPKRCWELDNIYLLISTAINAVPCMGGAIFEPQQHTIIERYWIAL